MDDIEETRQITSEDGFSFDEFSVRHMDDYDYWRR